jgi:hypothetical protein
MHRSKKLGHSMTSSASNNSDCGTVRPSDLAVLTFSSLLKNLEIGALLVFFALGFWGGRDVVSGR